MGVFNSLFYICKPKQFLEYSFVNIFVGLNVISIIYLKGRNYGFEEVLVVPIVENPPLERDVNVCILLLPNEQLHTRYPTWS